MLTGTVYLFVTENSSLAISTSCMVIATDVMSTHRAFFQGSGFPLTVSGSWLGSMCRAHIVLQELQVVVMMLFRMAFCLSGKVVTLHFDKSTAKAYLCIQDGTVSPFLSRQAAGY